MGGGGGAGSYAVAESPLPDYAAANVQTYLYNANALSNTAYAAYTGTTYAPRTSAETDGIVATAARATSGHAIISGAETLLQDVLDGDKFNTNPKVAAHFASLKEQILFDFKTRTLPGIHRAALLSGNWGSSGHHIMQTKAADEVIQRLSNIAEELFGGDYNDEREYQFSAAGRAIPYGMEEAKDMDILKQAGLYEREYQQGAIDDLFKKWKEIEMYKVKRLEILGNAIRAMVGAQVVSTKPIYRPSDWSQIAAIASTGIGVYATMYSGPKKDLPSSTPVLSLSGERASGQSQSFSLIPGMGASNIWQGEK
jgi:hypothetical protein